MIVGHPTSSKGIESVCDGRYIAVDSGIKSAHNLHSLTILNNNLAFDYGFARVSGSHSIEINKTWIKLTPQDPHSVNKEMAQAFAGFHTDSYPDAYSPKTT
jgi:hypothetical protein